MRSYDAVVVGAGNGGLTAACKLAMANKKVLMIERHNIQGGVGSAVAEVLMDEGCGNVPFKRLAFQDVNVTKVGSQAWLRDQYGLGVNDVINAVKEIVK